MQRLRAVAGLDFEIIELKQQFCGNRHTHTHTNQLSTVTLRPRGRGLIKYVFVPAGCTGSLQPLDISINEPFKQYLKEIFSNWYAEQVKNSLEKNDLVQNVKVDLKTSTIQSYESFLASTA